jgi:hypothetical protein
LLALACGLWARIESLQSKGLGLGFEVEVEVEPRQGWTIGCTNLCGTSYAGGLLLSDGVTEARQLAIRFARSGFWSQGSEEIRHISAEAARTSGCCAGVSQEVNKNERDNHQLCNMLLLESSIVCSVAAVQKTSAASQG